MLPLRKKSRGASSGFLMLEVIVSVLIIASGLTIVIKSYSTSLRAAEIAQALTKATLLLEDQLFLLESQDGVKEGQDSGEVKDEPGYSWSWTAVPLDAKKKDVNVVNLTVNYKKGSISRKIGITTFMKYKEG